MKLSQSDSIYHVGGSVVGLVSQIRNSIKSDVFTDAMLMAALSGTADRRYGMVKRALKAGDIIRLKRGLYVFGEAFQRTGVHLFQCAQMIYGPSYVSLESALAHHGWIPEAVYAITSISAKRSKEVQTPFGVFSYTHISSSDFFAGVKRMDSNSGVFLMASPWRALADYVYVHKLDWTGLRPLCENLRVDPSFFDHVDLRSIAEIHAAARSVRVRSFVAGIRKELDL